MENKGKLTVLEVEDLIKISGGLTAELVETNWWYCSNTKPCETTDFIGCSNAKPQLSGCS